VIRDRDIAGGLVYRAFRHRGEWLKPNTRLDADQVLSLPVKNRLAMVEAGHLIIYSRHEVELGAKWHDICLHWDKLEQIDPGLPTRLGELVTMAARPHLKWSAETIERARWALFSYGLSVVGWRDRGLAAGRIAADKLKHTPAAGSARTMLASYKAFQWKHPGEARKRTWRRGRDA
jgi:hypothetical protein